MVKETDPKSSEPSDCANGELLAFCGQQSPAARLLSPLPLGA